MNNTQTLTYDVIIEKIKQRLSKIPKVQKIILFGSAIWGKNHPDSDIDVLLIVDDSEKVYSWREKINRAVKYGMELVDQEESIPVDMIVYTQEEWEKLLSTGFSFATKIENEGMILYERKNQTLV